MYVTHLLSPLVCIYGVCGLDHSAQDVCSKFAVQQGPYTTAAQPDTAKANTPRQQHCSQYLGLLLPVCRLHKAQPWV
jgi:hypothetical protein